MNLPSPRVCSTKTRIKTSKDGSLRAIFHLREYVPLKQGLRLLWNIAKGLLCCLREYVPLKQGLRQIVFIFLLFLHYLREYVPLKQGLRLLMSISTLFFITPRVCSTKTRIKTVGKIICVKLDYLREYVPLKQGLRLTEHEHRLIIAFCLREYVPLKQGLRLFFAHICRKFGLSESMFH